jgi:GxxExxY protein
MALDRGHATERLAHEVIGAAIEVHRHIGPGQLEAVYHRAMEIELSLRNISYQSEFAAPIMFKGHDVGLGRIDLLIGHNQIVVELKAVEQLAPIHEAQLLAYLKNLNCPLGLLINFNVQLLKQGIVRRAN